MGVESFLGYAPGKAVFPSCCGLKGGAIQNMLPSKSEVLILYDNQAIRDDLLPSHGFSCLLRTAGGERVLFDTGESGPLLLANMGRLGIEPQSIQKVVLSHEHYDHVGGLSALLPYLTDAEIFILSSFSSAFEHTITSFQVRVKRVGQATEIASGLFSTGEVAGTTGEQGLVIAGEKKALFLGGCCHPGVVKMVEVAARITGQPVGGVLGGLHLYKSTDRAIVAVLRGLKDLGVDMIAPCHCTGFMGIDVAKELWESGFIQAGVGTRLTW